jgi:hypothetical protein
MIRLGLQLTLRGGREAAIRLTVIVLAVAIGVGLLLSTLAGINAVNSQNARYAWLETGYTPESVARAGDTATDPLWWWLGEDTFDGRAIGRVEVAATGPDSPVPPGIAHLPGPGEYYASPALSGLLASTPRGELGARYPGRQVGVIGSTALPAPDSLLIVIGRTVGQLAHAGQLVARISTVSPSNCSGCGIGVGINPNGMDLVLGVVGIAVLFPVLVFIGAATRLSAARREQRFAAMRLVGGTPRQIATIATVESAVAALAGVAVGFPLFFLIRGPLASLPFTGAPFFESDLALNPADIVAVAIGVPVAAAIAARLALRRVSVSPLGVTRRVTPKPPRIWRLAPLLAGIAELSYFAIAGPPGSTSGQTQAYFIGFLLIVVGLIVAGPWLTMTGSRLLARRAKRLPALIAGRRLADNPGAGFRAISGLVLALFVTSVAVGVITTLVAYGGGSGTATSAQAGTLFQPIFSDRDTGRPVASIDDVVPGLVHDLRATAGVTGVSVIHRDPVPQPPLAPNGTTVLACAQLADTPVIGRCPPGAHAVTVAPFFDGGDFGKSSAAETTWPSSTVSAARLRALPVHAIVVQTDGTRAALETARTKIEAAYPNRFAPDTLASLSPDSGRLLTAYKQLANVVILVSLPIAGCSLAVSVAGGLAERKRPFSLLRLSGVPLGALRRVVALETTVPLLVTAVVSVGTGLLAAQLFLRAQLTETLQPPGLQYYVIVVAGLVVALGIIAATLPLLRRMTGPETARNE